MRHSTFGRLFTWVTWGKAITGFIGLLILYGGWSGVRYIDTYTEKYIPSKIENEVNKQLPDAIKKQVPGAVKEELTAQIAEQIKSDIKTATDKTEIELFRRQDAHQQEINERIKAIWELVSRNQNTLGNSLKKSVSGNQVALKSTIPAGRELLEYAKAKALAVRSKENAPTISQQDFNELSKYLFRELRDPDINTKLRKMSMEVASYKTVVNGVEFGFPHPNRYSGYNVYVGDDDNFINTIIYDAHIILREGCPLSLKNVRFVNCTFEVGYEKNGMTFLKTLITSNKPTITLTLPPRPGYVKGACQK